MKNYTNEQLKRTLAKMLPEHPEICHGGKDPTCNILDTELLHLCWLVEEGLSAEQWNDYVGYAMADVHSIFTYKHLLHANWQQRTIALAKTLGVEIV